MSELFKPLEHVISNELIPVLVRHSANNAKRKLLALPQGMEG